jgi:hypothetical protein
MTPDLAMRLAVFLGSDGRAMRTVRKQTTEDDQIRVEIAAGWLAVHGTGKDFPSALTDAFEAFDRAMAE